jgi:RNA polymerase sigma factor (TIGR02999 family)
MTIDRSLMGSCTRDIGKRCSNPTRWRPFRRRGILGRVERASLQALFASASAGDPAASQQLFAALYGELRSLAQRELHRHAPGFALSPTTLLHEAYLDMSGRDNLAFPDRARFMSYAARAMRGLVIDYVRSRRAQKRGGEFRMTALTTDVPDATADEGHLQRISEALDALASIDAHLAQVVDLKFFCGFSFAEIAAMRGSSERTIQRDWEKARIYLHRALQSDQAP